MKSEERMVKLSAEILKMDVNNKRTYHYAYSLPASLRIKSGIFIFIFLPFILSSQTHESEVPFPY